MLYVATKLPCQGCQRCPISLTALGMHNCEKKRKVRKKIEKKGGGEEKEIGHDSLDIPLNATQNCMIFII
jgi:hypothetical protein